MPPEHEVNSLGQARGVMSKVTRACLVLLLAGGAALEAQEKKGPAKDPVFRGKALSVWIKALEGKALAGRIEALNALREAGADAKPAVPALIGVFRDSDVVFIHPLAASTLARIGPV